MEHITMSDFLIFKAAFNNSATPAIGTYTAEGATAQFNNDPDVSPDYYLYNTAAGSTAVQWFVPTAETTDFEFVADILTDDQSLDGDRYFIIADSTGTTGLCMLSSSSITEWRFMNGDSTATSDPEYVGAIDPATSGGFGVFHQFRVRVRKLTASSSSVEVYVDGTLKLTATAGAALVTCAKIGFIGGVTGSPSTDSGIKNAYVYDLSGRELVDRGVLSDGFNRLINWAKNDSGFITSEIDSMGTGWVRFKCGIQTVTVHRCNFGCMVRKTKLVTDRDEFCLLVFPVRQIEMLAHAGNCGNFHAVIAALFDCFCSLDDHCVTKDMTVVIVDVLEII